MPFLVIMVGGVLAMVAYNDTQDQLATDLEQDLPGFLKWFAAVVGIAVLGFIPGMQKFSRMLLALVIVVIILKNYKQVLASFEGLSGAAPSASTIATQTPVTPEAAYAASIDPLAGLGGSTESAMEGFGAGLGAMGSVAGAVPDLIGGLAGFF